MSSFTKWGLRLTGGLLLLAAVILSFDRKKLRRLMRVNSLFKERKIVSNFSNMKSMFLFREMAVRSDAPTPLPENPRPLPRTFTFRGTAITTKDWQKQRHQTAMMVLKNGQITYEAYFLGTRASDRRISWSMAKSFLSAAFGVAVHDGLIPSLEGLVSDHVPTLKGGAYDRVTIRNVLNMASGIKFTEDYLDFYSDINRVGRVLAVGKSMDGFARGLRDKLRAPGARRQYISIDTHVLGMVLRAATGKRLPEYLAEKILKPLGMEADAYYITDGFSTAFALGGLNLCTRDYARFGLLMVQNGTLNNQQIVPKDWISQSTANSAPPPYDGDLGTDNGLLGYGFQWWLPPDAAVGEFFAIGVYGQYIYVNQRAQVVIALNAADRDFRDGSGRITLSNIAMFRAIVQDLGKE